MTRAPNQPRSPIREVLPEPPPARSRTKAHGRPLWLQTATLAIILIVASRALSAMPTPTVRTVGETIQPYCTTIATGLGLATLVLFVLWLPRRLFERDRNRAGRGEEPEQGAVADYLKVPPDQISTQLRIWPYWRWPFWQCRRIIIWMPRGKADGDPSKDLIARLEPMLGAIRKKSWKPRRGRLVLVHGSAPPDDETVEIPEAEDDPQKRAVQVVSKILRTEQVKTEVIHETDEGVTAFRMRHPTDIRVGGDNANQVISDRLSTMMPEAPGGRGWRVQVDPRQDLIDVTSRPEMPTFLPHPQFDYNAEFGKRFLPFGQPEDGPWVGWDISPSTKGPHCLLSGATGSGKTSTIRSIVVGATRQSGAGNQQVEVWGLDPKMIELMGLNGWPGVTRLAYTIGEMAKLIEAAHDEMMDRYDRILRREAHPSELPVLLFILDEFLVLRGQLIRWWKEELAQKGQPPQLGMLNEMLALARVAAVHLCIGIQRPDATHFDDGARDNMGTRVAHEALSAQGRQMMWGDQSQGILVSGDIRGRAMASDRRYQPVESQMFWTPDLDAHPMARRWMSEDDTALIDGLRPADYTPHTLTKDGLYVPETGSTHIPAGSVQSEMMDSTAEMVRVRDLAPGDRIKLDRGGRWEEASVEDNPYEVGDDSVDLQIVWDNGGGGETIGGSDPSELIYTIEHNDPLLASS